MELNSKSSKGYLLSVVGLIVLSFTVMTSFIYFIGEGKQFFSPKYSVYMTIPNIDGLFRDSFVAIGGLKVGVVGTMEFDVVDDEHLVRVELRVDRRYKNKITESSVAQIKSLGVLGDKFIDITPGVVGEEPVPPGSIIQSVPVRNMDDLFHETEKLFGMIETTMDDVQTLLATVLEGSSVVGKLLVDEQAGTSLARTLQRMDALTQQLESGEGTLGQIMQDTVLYASLRNSTERIDRLLTHVESGEGMLGKLIMDEKFAQSVTSLIDQTDGFLHNVQNKGTTARLLSDDALYTELISLTKSMRSLLVDLQENPKRYVTFRVF